MSVFDIPNLARGDRPWRLRRTRNTVSLRGTWNNWRNRRRRLCLRAFVLRYKDRTRDYQAADQHRDGDQHRRGFAFFLPAALLVL
jgi:hypothetical protein